MLHKEICWFQMAAVSWSVAAVRCPRVQWWTSISVCLGNRGLITQERGFPVVVPIITLGDSSNNLGSIWVNICSTFFDVFLIVLDLLCKFTSSTYHLIHGWVAPNMLISSGWSLSGKACLEWRYKWNLS
jgi:hypothetical protein